MKLQILPVLLSAIMCVPLVSAQDEIEIVNENGERVGKAAVQVQMQQRDGNAIVVGPGQIKIDGDKIIIVDENGETREIDISGAKSVSVQQSMKTVDKDGDQKTVRQGKAIIITPDGERQVIELGDGVDGVLSLPELDMELLGDLGQLGEMPQGLRMFRGGLPGTLRMSAGSVGKYMIGVNCAPVSEGLRAQLDLAEGMGLIIQSVSPESPASKAGLQKHDILMSAEDKELSSNQDLVGVIQTVGKEGESLSMTVIRSGKELSVSVTPMERPESETVVFGGPDFEFKQFGPGVIVGEDNENPMLDMQDQIEKMRAQMQEMEEMMRQRMERLDRDR